MRKLVQQTEPEIVESVVAERQADDRGAVGQLKRRSVEMRARQMGKADQMNAMLRQELLSEAWAVLRPAQPGDLAEERLRSTVPGL